MRTSVVYFKGKTITVMRYHLCSACGQSNFDFNETCRNCNANMKEDYTEQLVFGNIFKGGSIEILEKLEEQTNLYSRRNT